MITIQQDGGFAKTVEAGIEAVERLLPRANQCDARAGPGLRAHGGAPVRRLRRLVGSDRQPGLGAAADLIVRQGGTVVLGETTEVYGGEHLLTRRAKTPEVAQKLIDRIHWWEQYTAYFGASIDNNPRRATSWAG